MGTSAEVKSAVLRRINHRVKHVLRVINITISIRSASYDVDSRGEVEGNRKPSNAHTTS